MNKIKSGREEFLREAEIKEEIYQYLEERKYEGARRNEIARHVGRKIYGHDLRTGSKEFKKLGKKIDKILRKMVREGEINNRKEKREEGKGQKRTVKSTYWLPVYSPTYIDIEKEIMKYREEISKGYNQNGESWLNIQMKEKLSHRIPVGIITSLTKLSQLGDLQKDDILKTHHSSQEKLLMKSNILFIIAALTHPDKNIREKSWKILDEFYPMLGPSHYLR